MASRLAEEPGVRLAYLLTDNGALADIIFAVAGMPPAAAETDIPPSFRTAPSRQELAHFNSFGWLNKG